MKNHLKQQSYYKYFNPVHILNNPPWHKYGYYPINFDIQYDLGQKPLLDKPPVVSFNPIIFGNSINL